MNGYKQAFLASGGNFLSKAKQHISNEWEANQKCQIINFCNTQKCLWTDIKNTLISTGKSVKDVNKLFTGNYKYSS